MFGNSNGNIKSQGVRGNANYLSDEQGTPQTLVNVTPMEFFGVEFIDGDGKRHITTVVRTGNALWFAPNSEQWTSQLKPAAKWFKERFEVMAGKPGASLEVPKVDTVDVMGAMAQKV